jgi:hypothetical protein
MSQTHRLQIDKSAILIASTLLAATLGSGQSPALRPSNGVLELSAVPFPAPDSRPAAKRIEKYFPWYGSVEITIRNISFAPAILQDTSCDFGFEVFDSAGRPVEQTEDGKKCAEIHLMAHPNIVTSISHQELAPNKQTVYPLTLSAFFKIEPGHAYTVVIRRSRGLPKVDELGRPLKDVEVSCSFDVPDYGIPRPTRRR